MEVAFILPHTYDDYYQPWEKCLSFEHYYDRFAKALLKRGYHLTIYVPTKSDSEIRSFKHKYGHSLLRVPLPRSVYGYLPGKAGNLLREYDIWDKYVNNVLPPLFRQRGVEIAHFANFNSRAFAMADNLTSQTPSVAGYAGATSRLLELGVGLHNNLKRWLVLHRLRQATPRVLRNVRALYIPRDIQTQIESLKRIYSRIRADLPLVSLSSDACVDPSIFYVVDQTEARHNLGWNLEKIHILSVTHIYADYEYPPRDYTGRNPFQMVRIWNAGAAHLQNVILHIIGGGSSQDVEAFRKVLPPNAIYEGEKTHEELREYYGASDIVLNPFGTSSLSSGNSTGEAFSCSRPVIAFASSDDVPLRLKGGFAISHRPEVGGRQLLDILGDERKILELRDEARELAPLFSMESVADRLAEGYKRCSGR